MLIKIRCKFKFYINFYNITSEFNFLIPLLTAKT
nr:MAG TPA: hypothetical protein [Caudoviricetes sp.]